MVRLKGGLCFLAWCNAKISIPYGAIKSMGPGGIALMLGNFNSLWCD